MNSKMVFAPRLQLHISNRDDETNNQKLLKSLARIPTTFEVFKRKSKGWKSLLQSCFGTSGEVNDRVIGVELLDAKTMKKFRGAYTASNQNNEERIYLNSTWLKTATLREIKSVLLEEIGHSIDHQLNGGYDSPGDEGAIFSSLIQDQPIISFELNQNDS